MAGEEIRNQVIKQPQPHSLIGGYMNSLVSRFTIGSGMMVAEIYGGAVFLDNKAIYLIAHKNLTSEGGRSGAIAGAMIANSLEGAPDLLSASVSQLPIAAREHKALQKAPSLTRIGVIEKSDVRKIEFNLLSGVSIGLGKMLIGLSMMPWSFGKAKKAFISAGWTDPRYGLN